MRSLIAAAAVGAVACAPTCPIDLADSGCVTRPECADAGEGVACSDAGATCNLCVASYHSYLATCEVQRDGGLAWSVARGIPPQGCPPN